MKITPLTKQQAQQLWADGSSIDPVTPDILTSDEREIRTSIEHFIALDRSSSLHAYELDLELGLELYTKILSFDRGMTLRMAANDSVWRQITLRIVPDIVAIRWPADDDGIFPAGRFWKQPQRNWFKAIWWYIHLSWQGSRDATLDRLKKGSTDSIMQLVDRAGTSGYRLDFTRALMARIGDPVSVEMFRKVLKLHTARMRCLEPTLHPGGIASYVDDLITEIQGSPVT
jgi:hypothetical protein